MQRARVASVLALLLTAIANFSPLPAAAAATLPNFFEDVGVASGLDVPRSLAFLPSGAMLVAENVGTVQYIENGSARQVLDMSTAVVTGGEQGLLGLAVDPGFPAKPYVYFHYTSSGSPSYVKVARYTFDNATGPGPLGIDPASSLVLLDDMPNNRTNHNGGTVRFGPDGRLYISIGDDAANGCDAQNLAMLAGKILRLSVDEPVNPADRASLAPPDNPFVANPNPNAKLVWALGLRNPFRFDIDPVDGRLFIGDVGQSAWEEVDVSAGGENFGWPYFEGNHTYQTSLCAGQSAIPAWTRPVYEYPNPGGASVIMAALYRQAAYPSDWSLPPEFNGNPFFTDFSSGNLRVLRFNSSSTRWDLVAGTSATNFGTGLPAMTDMRAGPDGALYYLTAASNELRRIVYHSEPQIQPVALPGASIGEPYTATISATGNSTPFAWAVVAGALPGGLSLNASTGRIEGVPSSAGSFDFTVQVTNAAGRNASRPFNLLVTDLPRITTASLPDGMQGRSYSATLQVTGGLAPYRWNLSAGSLPAGLALDFVNGTVAGSPDAAGLASLELRLNDSQGRSAFANLTLRIFEALTVVTSGLPRGEENMSYDATLVASGGTAPYTWQIVSGTFPAGLALNSSSGRINGTATAADAVRITVQVTDSLAWTSTRALDLVIVPPPGGPPIIVTTTLPPAGRGHSYGATLEVAGGAGAYSWDIAGGALPPGLALNGTTGAISGVPTDVGNFSATFRVTDAYARQAARTLVITVAEPFREIRLSGDLAFVFVIGVAVMNRPLGFHVESSNVTMPLRYNATGLPSGLVVLPNGSLEGRATQAGVFVVSVTVADAGDPAVTGSRNLTITVQRVAIATLSFSRWTVGQSVVAPVVIENGSGATQWNVTGELPPGLRIDETGTIRGTPTQSGTFNFSLSVADPANPTNSDSQSYAVTVDPAPGKNPTGIPLGMLPWILAAILLATVLLVAVVVARRRTGDDQNR